jgi:hypothetical protein
MQLLLTKFGGLIFMTCVHPVRGSLVVKALCYKPEGRVIDYG